MVGPAIAILPRRAPEFRHREDRDVGHPIAEVLDQRRDRLREVVETIARAGRCAALIDVRVPTANVGKRDLEPDVRLDQLRNLAQVLAERRPRIVGVVLRDVLLRVRRLEIFIASNISPPAA